MEDSNLPKKVWAMGTTDPALVGELYAKCFSDICRVGVLVVDNPVLTVERNVEQDETVYKLALRYIDLEWPEIEGARKLGEGEEITFRADTSAIGTLML